MKSPFPRLRPGAFGALVCLAALAFFGRVRASEESPVVLARR